MEYNRDASSFKRTDNYEKLIEKYYDHTNLFFASWIKDTEKNRSRSNINKINRISIDIDFRKQYRDKYWYDCSDSFIIEQWIDLWKYLINNYPHSYGEFSYIIYSWNGLHIHYLWDIYEIKSPLVADLYRRVCLDFYTQFNSIVYSEVLNADLAVWDLGHLFRLPNTINEKNWIKKQCQIILRQDKKSSIVNNLQYLFNQASIQLKRENEIRKEIDELNSTRVDTFYWDDIWSRINRVPVSDIIQLLIPERRLKPDGKNFFDPKKWNANASYFVDTDNNILIRNWSTKLPWTQEWFSSALLIKEWFWFNWKQTKDWFESKWYLK